MLKQHFAPDGGAEREHNATPTTLGFGVLHYALVTNLRPRRALVIGSRYGFIPSVIAMAMSVNGVGELDFVDASYADSVQGFAVAFGGVGHWTASPDSRFESLGLESLIHLHVMRADEFFRTCTSRFSYIYLDGDHSYDGCRHDFDHAVALAEPGAIIVLHDVLVTRPEFGVGRLFSELSGECYDKLLIPAWPGLGLVQPKPPDGARR
jgi:hypothetical protein